MPTYVHTLRARPARSLSYKLNDAVASVSQGLQARPDSFQFYLQFSARASRFGGRFWASGGMLDSLPRTPMNHRAKFDAASFVVGGQILDRSNTHTQNYVLGCLLVAGTESLQPRTYFFNH